MGLINAGYSASISPCFFYGGTGTASSHRGRAYVLTGLRKTLVLGEGIPGDARASIPSGASHPVAWILPQKANRISSRRLGEVQVTSSATGIQGRPGVGEGSFLISGEAVGQLVSSGVGTGAIGITGGGVLRAALLAVGAVTTEIIGSGLLGAEASGVAEAALSVTGALVPYGIGYMEGSTVDQAEISPAAIASAVWAADAGEIVRKMLENKVVKSGTFVTIYDDDGQTVWRMYDLTDGGRVRL